MLTGCIKKIKLLEYMFVSSLFTIPLFFTEFGQHCSSPLLTQQLNQLSRELADLLKASPDCRLPLNKFIPSYHHHFGRQCRVADYGYTKLIELFEAVPHVVQVFCDNTIKFLNFRKPEKLCYNHPKTGKKRFYHRVMHPKDADSIANSEDPDQTAPLGAV